MPIQKLLATSEFTPEQRHSYELAFNAILRKLSLVDRNDPLCDMVARKVIQIGAAGYTNAVQIAELAVKHFSRPPY
jgi:hypothetical protein